MVNQKLAGLLNLRNDYKVALCILAWYSLSLVTLWTNRYVVAELHVSSSVLSLAQLGMSVVCGVVSEVYLVGWIVCLDGFRKLLRDGLKDMLILGGVRVLTVMFGLIALKYIAVSFSQTIKSAAPFFTVILTYVLLNQRTDWRVVASLMPIVTGLVFCSLADTSFHKLGFIAALACNCFDCIQNVLTKKLLNKSYSVCQLQLYTSIVAVGFLLVSNFYNWMCSPVHLPSGANHDDARSSLYLVVLLTVDGLGFYLQSAFAYVLMSLVSPVTHSVANCAKRALLITLSIYHFGDKISPLNWSGITLVIVGVYIFNAASRKEQPSVSDSKEMVAPVSTDTIEQRTVAKLFEIVIDRHKQ